MTGGVVELSIVLPRTAFTAREAARSADVFRAFQDVAVEGASACGWPPQRMREVPSYWVVRAMTVVHARETTFGERLAARTHVSRNRRGTLSTRELSLHAPDGLVARATQEWAHLGPSGPCRMPEAMERDLGLVPSDSVELPPFEPATGASFGLGFEVWESWMDPLGHVNHPQYVDFGDESLLRAMRTRGLDPLDLVPVADRVTYRKPLLAGTRVVVTSTPVGRGPDGLRAFDHQIRTEEGELACEVRSLRRSRSVATFEAAFPVELTDARA